LILNGILKHGKTPTHVTLDGFFQNVKRLVDLCERTTHPACVEGTTKTRYQD
jgi:hypothetical protein